MSNNVAPNNGLVDVTWICSSKLKLVALLKKTLLYSIQELTKASHTNNHQNHHVICYELKWVHRYQPFGRWIHHNLNAFHNIQLKSVSKMEK